MAEIEGCGMIVPTDLHVHESSMSNDSRTPARRMQWAAHNKLGDFALLGFVGHEGRPSLNTSSVLTITGAEEVMRVNPTPLEILNFPAQELKILAHPKITWPRDTREKVQQFLMENPDVDAVEKWNSGRLQYEGTVRGALEVAGSDAHTPLTIGSSYMAVETDTVSRDGVLDAVMSGNYSLVNQPPSFWTRWASGIERRGTLLWKNPDAAFEVGKRRVGLKSQTVE